MEMIKLFFIGSLISFLGQLPLGNMNLTATQLSVQENLRSAWKYGLGIVLVEIIYLRLALTGMDWVVEHKVLFAIMGWLTVIVFIVLGVLAFVMARKQTSAKKGLLLNNKKGVPYWSFRKGYRFMQQLKKDFKQLQKRDLELGL